MKQRDLIKRLEKAGFRLLRQYVRGADEEQIPRHKEINEKLAQAILRKWNL